MNRRRKPEPQGAFDFDGGAQRRHGVADATYQAVLSLRRSGFDVYRVGEQHQIKRRKGPAMARLVTTLQLQAIARAVA